MSMMQQQMTRDSSQTTLGEYNQEIPNTQPTDTAYVNWKAQNYTTTARINKGGTDTTDTVNRWYSHYHMWRYHKILKRNSKLGATAMAA